jgi:hypothetical protein
VLRPHTPRHHGRNLEHLVRLRSGLCPRSKSNCQSRREGVNRCQLSVPPVQNCVRKHGTDQGFALHAGSSAGRTMGPADVACVAAVGQLGGDDRLPVYLGAIQGTYYQYISPGG